MIKRHSYDIVKLYIDQIGITVFSFILITALGSVSDSAALQIGLSTFTTLFFGVILYTTAWDLGAKDKLSLDSGRAEYHPLKGLALSLFANLPNFILAGGAAICFLLSFTGVDAFYSIGAVLLTIAKFTMAIYLGIINVATSFAGGWGTLGALVQSIAYCIIPFAAVFFTQLGYSFGLKEKKLFGGAADPKRK